MAKYKLQEMPDMQNKGKKRVYPKLVANRALSTKEFIDKMHSYNHALSESVVGAVLEDLFEKTYENSCICTIYFVSLHSQKFYFQSWNGHSKPWNGRSESRNGRSKIGYRTFK